MILRIRFESSMKLSICQMIAFAMAGIFYLQPVAQAQYLDQIGVTLLRATTTNLNGTGIRVAHPEDRPDAPNEQAWEVNPANVGQPVSRFTYASADGIANTFPNALGINSFPSHADDVANKFYGIPNGVATNVAHVDNFEETYFFDHYIAGSVALNDPLVSQSYTFGPDQKSVV